MNKKAFIFILSCFAVGGVVGGPPPLLRAAKNHHPSKSEGRPMKESNLKSGCTAEQLEKSPRREKRIAEYRSHRDKGIEHLVSGVGLTCAAAIVYGAQMLLKPAIASSSQEDDTFMWWAQTTTKVAAVAGLVRASHGAYQALTASTILEELERESHEKP